MQSLRRRARSGRAAGAALCAVAIVAALSGTASAATAGGNLPPVGTFKLFNGNFSRPGPAANEGAPPTGWTLVDLGAETAPFKASIGVYNAKGQFPPPAGNPNRAGIADNVFYQAGSSTGIEGIGAEQTHTTFNSIVAANNPQLSFSDVQAGAPQAKVANWAGSGVEINFIHKGAPGTTYSIIFFNPWTAFGSTPFPGTPADSATTHYVLGPTLTANTWNKQGPISINKAVDAAFGFKSYHIESVVLVDLEDTTSAAFPYPNMNGYFASVNITEGPIR